MTEPCIVLVTGGAGCLGQHVIGLLQTRAKHVTGIRVLDLVPYENKLDHLERLEVKTITGSINNEAALTKACRGAHSVIHLASIVDYSMFPDIEKTMKINVQGTSSLLKVATESGTVQRLIYCSSVVVATGEGNEDKELTEEMPLPDVFYFEPYSTSKVEAEQLVLAANSPSFLTVVLRPSTMYGELDRQVLIPSIQAAKRGFMMQIKCNVTHQHAYVGNVAWCFVCAENRLHSQKVDVHLLRTAEYSKTTGSQVKQMNCSQMTTDDSTCNVISGEVFFVADDTESEHTFKFHEYYWRNCDLSCSAIKCPLIMFKVFVYSVYFILKCLSFLGVHWNFPIAPMLVNFFNQTFIFSDKKARERLGYSPIYSTEECKRKSLQYYQKICNEMKQ